MASKLAAAKIAAWSGVRAVIASAALPDVVADALAGRSVGTSFAPRAQRLAEPQALDRVRAGRPKGGSSSTPARGARWSTAASRCSPAGVRGVEGDVRRRRAGRDRRRRRRGVRQGPVPLHVAPARRRPRAAAPPTSPKASPTRSSTATTSSSCRREEPTTRRRGSRAPRPDSSTHGSDCLSRFGLRHGSLSHPCANMRSWPLPNSRVRP